MGRVHPRLDGRAPAGYDVADLESVLDHALDVGLLFGVQIRIEGVMEGGHVLLIGGMTWPRSQGHLDFQGSPLIGVGRDPRSGPYLPAGSHPGAVRCRPPWPLRNTAVFQTSLLAARHK